MGLKGKQPNNGHYARTTGRVGFGKIDPYVMLIPYRFHYTHQSHSHPQRPALAARWGDNFRHHCGVPLMIAFLAWGYFQY